MGAGGVSMSIGGVSIGTGGDVSLGDGGRISIGDGVSNNFIQSSIYL